MTTRDQFRHASLHLQAPEMKPRLDDSPVYLFVRWKLYGYNKQATQGDCKMPMPDADNVVLRRKWEAWMDCKGLSQDQAMKAYIQLVVEIDPTYKPLEGTAAALPPADGIQVALSKTGTLYKQRDHIKGWRSRKFVLQETLLSYYVDEQDLQPKAQIDVSGNKVTLGANVKIPPSEDNFATFTLSLPTMTKPYVLACAAEDVDSWVEALQRAAMLPSLPAAVTPAATPALMPAKDETTSRDTFVVAEAAPSPAAAVPTPAAAHAPSSYSSSSSRKSETTPPTSAPSSSSKSSKSSSSKSSSSSSSCSSSSNGSTPTGPLAEPVYPAETLRDIPAQFSDKIERAVERLMGLISGPGWEQMYDEDGLVAMQRPGAIICVRGDIQMPYGISPIFDIIMDTSRNSEINPQVSSAHKTECFSPNTAVQHLKFKPVWPTAARDMVNLTHWRLLPDQRLVIISFAEPAFDEANPADRGATRAELIIGGYVITPQGNGSTNVKYVVQSDLKGSIPSAVATFVSRSQPRILLNIRALLDKTAKRAPLDPIVPSFHDLVAISNKYVPKASAAPTSSPAEESHAAPASSSSQASRKSPLSLSGMLKALLAVDVPPETLHLLVFFLPSLIYYALDARFRNVGFVLGAFICLRFFRRIMLGDPVPKRSSVYAPSLAAGRIVVRFPVDLGKLLRYVDVKHKESGVDITLTHVAIKAAAATIQEFPFLNGYMVGGDFYTSRSKGVDISVSTDASEAESVGLLMHNVDTKPLHCLADEVQAESRQLLMACRGKDASPTSQYAGRVLALLPAGLGAALARFFSMLGSEYGLNIEALGAVPYPLGVCSIITAPHKGEESIDLDINLAMIPSANSATQPPVVITIGGVSIRTTVDADRKVSGVPVLNMCVAIDSRACSLVESRKFCARFQQIMTTHPWEENNQQQAKSAAPVAVAVSGRGR